VGLGSDPILSDQWVFKGGTCLKKCYIETHRFSEDLDVTVLPGSPYCPEQIERLILRLVAERRIGYFKLGGRVMFSKADLDRFIEDGRQEPRDYESWLLQRRKGQSPRKSR